MRFICDSNYGERTISFAPLQAYWNGDQVIVVNPLYPDIDEVYPSIEVAATARGFIRR